MPKPDDRLTQRSTLAIVAFVIVASIFLIWILKIIVDQYNTECKPGYVHARTSAGYACVKGYRP